MGFVPVVLQYSLTVYEIFIALVSVFQMTCLVTRGRIAYQIVEGIFNPRRACAARVTVLGLCVCLCVCVSVTQHLTLYVIIRATNDTNLLSGG